VSKRGRRGASKPSKTTESKPAKITKGTSGSVPTGKGSLYFRIASLVPWSKLRKYEITNLCFDGMALFVAWKWAMQQGASWFSVGVLFVTLALGFICVVWASKQ
jgi:hypothetical protein